MGNSMAVGLPSWHVRVRATHTRRMDFSENGKFQINSSVFPCTGCSFSMIYEEGSVVF
jgi:hypothetical protein